MPVRYSPESSGPSTRRADNQEWAAGGPTTAVTSSSQMTKQELVAIARERGLPTSGTKKQLIERLSGLDV